MQPKDIPIGSYVVLMHPIFYDGFCYARIKQKLTHHRPYRASATEKAPTLIQRTIAEVSPRLQIVIPAKALVKAIPQNDSDITYRITLA